ncbi:B-box zinc finger protein [Chloroflexota bacterium]
METTRCAKHPEVETGLKCGKCGQPICPKCMVQTPVGARCTGCARLYKLPTYRVSAIYYLRAAGTALGMAIAGGLAWGIVSAFIPFIYLNIILAGGVGYAIGEVISRAVNRKRGTGLAVIAGLSMALSYLVNIVTFGHLPAGLFSIVFDLVAIGAGIFMAANRLR